MSDHPFDNEFAITGQHKEQFLTDGFVKLEGFFNASVIDTLLDRVEVEMSRKPRGEIKAVSRFSRVKYDFERNRNDIFELLDRPYFRRALTDLVEHDLFLTFEVMLRTWKERQPGIPVACRRAEFRLSTRQMNSAARCGRRCIQSIRRASAAVWLMSPRTLCPAISSSATSNRRLSRPSRPWSELGKETDADQYSLMRAAILNAPPMVDILEHHQVEDDFEPRRRARFQQFVVHRSIMLGDGMLPRRAAYVMPW